MEIHNKTTELMLAADFMLSHCPIDEINNESIRDIIESFRFDMMNRQSALGLLLNHHQKFLEKYLKIQQALREEGIIS